MPRMPIMNFSCCAAVILGAGVLAGCSISSSDGNQGSIGQQIGLIPGTPDAFLIISKEPLELPPDFSLPVPQPGVASPREPDPYAEARASLFGTPAEPQVAGTESAGELALLSSAGASADNSAIRTEIEDLPPGEYGNRSYGLNSLFGVPIPERGSEKAGLETLEENETLQKEGLPTPTAPPVALEEERLERTDVSRR